MCNGETTVFNSHSVMKNVDLLEPMCKDVPVDNDESDDGLAETQEELNTTIESDDEKKWKKIFLIY